VLVKIAHHLFDEGLTCDQGGDSPKNTRDRKAQTIDRRKCAEVASKTFDVQNDVTHKKTDEARGQANSTTILPIFCPWKRRMKAPTVLSIPSATISWCFTLPALKWPPTSFSNSARRSNQSLAISPFIVNRLVMMLNRLEGPGRGFLPHSACLGIAPRGASGTADLVRKPTTSRNTYGFLVVLYKYVNCLFFYTLVIRTNFGVVLRYLRFLLRGKRFILRDQCIVCIDRLVIIRPVLRFHGIHLGLLGL